ncbi:putative membrane protein [Burkholderia thailandensis 34]|uniref:winged helix-turn-helix domain-containing protein n=1 Tax=Burkholderia thailandensis TaxID=57975 RepID=UPI0005DA2700|nr:transcriptional regulator [Burkholderia thailandensis]AJY31104.1 putative membrane protein [Burkholderia thailandensis 34]AOJ58813.1 transcriptional regulator [Burkholderia thailandensis]KXF57933.1 transcriptional regulator [Burkholderia thailandensis]PNE77319.1 transcriptional regulator [Burkholderia thailandensis]
MKKYLIEDLVTFDAHLMTLTHRDQTTELTTNESELLQMVLDGVATKAAVIQQVWGSKGLVVTDSSYHQLVRSVRGRLEEHGISGALIKTLPRQGLKFLGSAQALTDAPVPAAEQGLADRDEAADKAPRAPLAQHEPPSAPPAGRARNWRRTLRFVERALLAGLVVWVGLVTWKMISINDRFPWLTGHFGIHTHAPVSPRSAGLKLLASIGVRPGPGERVYEISRNGDRWLAICAGARHSSDERCTTYSTRDLTTS